MRRALLAIVLGVLAAPPLGAQSGYTVRGVVRDTALAPLAGVEVIVLSPRTSVLTDATGRFQLDGVPGGQRQLLIRRIGYLPVRPSVQVPQSASDTVQAVLLPAPQNLPPLIVESERPGIRGVVGDTGYRALPSTLVELLGARMADTTDERGRFAFEGLKQAQYMLRVSRVGYAARLLSVDLGKRGREYSIFLEPYRPGLFDWANTREAANALADLATRLSTEFRRTRMTREELARYSTMALCDIPRLRSHTRREEPNVVVRGSDWIKGASLCAWTADEVDLLEWGNDPCIEAAKTLAAAMGVECNPGSRSLYGSPPSITGRGPFVVIWPRN